MQHPPIRDRLFFMRGRQTWKWDEFKEIARRRFAEQLYVTISPKNGEFVVSMHTYLKMNEPKAVVLLYDADARTIGVRPSSFDVPNAIAVRVRHFRYSRVFRSRKFF